MPNEQESTQLATPAEVPAPTLPTMELLDAAKYLHMSPAVLRQKAKRGLIPGAKPGKRWVFLSSALADYLQIGRAHV